MNTKPTEWVVDGLIPRDSQTTIFGKPGVGKSLLALDLAIKMSHTEPVLYLDYEMSTPMLRDRMVAFGQMKALDNGLNYHLFAGDDVPALDTAEGADALGILLAEYGAHIVVIDAMSGAVQGGENDNDTYRNFETHTSSKMRKHGVTTLRIDHLSIKGDQHAGPRGASRKIDDVDMAWEYQKAGLTGQYTLKNRKNRAGTAAHQVPVKMNAQPLGFIVGTDTTVQALTEKELAIVRYLDNQHLPMDTGRDRCREALAGTEWGQSRNETLSNAIRYRKTRLGDSPGDSTGTSPLPYRGQTPPPSGVSVPEGSNETVENPMIAREQDDDYRPTPY